MTSTDSPASPTSSNPVAPMPVGLWTHRLDQRTIDIGAVVTAMVLAVIALLTGFDNGEPTGALGYLIAIAGCALLFGRRAAALPVLVGVTGMRLLQMLVNGNEHALLPATAIAIYTVVRWRERRSALVLAVVLALVMALAAASLHPLDEPFLFELLPEIAVGLLPIAIGDALRVRADRLDQLVESRIAARVQDERLAIARDLHDTVAHGLSTIAVQSGVAAHLLDRHPEQAREALEIINGTCTSALQELRGMVGVLRSTDDAPLRPTPADPDDLSDLVATARQAGVDVALDVHGVFPTAASDGAIVAVHRIVEEALANVVRHAGPVAATVSVAHRDGYVTVEVVNPIPDDRPVVAPSTGVGIVGMRERAEAMGGQLRAGPSDDRFRVTATIPYQADAR